MLINNHCTNDHKNHIEGALLIKLINPDIQFVAVGVLVVEIHVWEVCSLQVVGRELAFRNELIDTTSAR